jgi:hypothetical protein
MNSTFPAFLASVSFLSIGEGTFGISAGPFAFLEGWSWFVLFHSYVISHIF